jgi:hypothetical protein
MDSPPDVGTGDLPCLPESTWIDLIGIDAAFPFCVVRIHAASELPQEPTPGWHDAFSDGLAPAGPLTFRAVGSALALQRWVIPADPLAQIDAIQIATPLLAPPAGSRLTTALSYGSRTLLAWWDVASGAGTMHVLDGAYQTLSSAALAYPSSAAFTAGGAIVYGAGSPLDDATTPYAAAFVTTCPLSDLKTCASEALDAWSAPGGLVASTAAAVFSAGSSAFGWEVHGFATASAPQTATTLATSPGALESLASVGTWGEENEAFVVYVPGANPNRASALTVHLQAVVNVATTIPDAIVAKDADSKLALFSDRATTLWLALHLPSSQPRLLAFRHK